MDNTQFQETAKLTYRFAERQRKRSIIIGTVSAVCGFGVAISGFLQHPSNPMPFFVFPAIFLGFSIFMFLRGIRSRITIEGERISVRGAFEERSAVLGEIDGFRKVIARNGSYRQLILKHGHGTIDLPDSFETDSLFDAWLSQLLDLDACDRDKLLARIQEQEELGNSLEEWLAKLVRARVISILLLLAVAFDAALLNLAPDVLIVPFATLLIALPLVGAYFALRSPRLYGMFKKKSDPRAELFYALLMAAFGLLIRLRGLHFVSPGSLISIMFAAFLAIALSNHRSAKNSGHRSAFIAVLILAAIYGYSAVMVADVFFDTARSNRYTSDVVSAHTSSGQFTTYYLQIAPWGPISTQEEISVPESIYNGTRAGDTVCFDLHPGALRSRWYQVVSCVDASL